MKLRKKQLKEIDEFISFTKKLVAVPKKEIDEQLKLDREKKEKQKEKINHFLFPRFDFLNFVSKSYKSIGQFFVG